MRLIHTSDWHLGRIFHGTHLTDDQEFVLQQFVDLVKDTRPDAVIIAGDIYDRAIPPPEAVNLLDEIVSRVALDLGVPLIMIAGNHDSPERLSFGSRLFSKRNVHMIGALRKTPQRVHLNDDHGTVEFIAVPYAEPPVVREKLELESVDSHASGMKALIDQINAEILSSSGQTEPPSRSSSGKSSGRRVLVTHAFVAGGQESDSERPLSVGGSGTVNAADFAGFEYVALGHLHRPQQVLGERVSYSGSLMKYSFSESGHKKSISIVELDGKGDVKADRVSLSVRRDVRILEGSFIEIQATASKDPGKHDYLCVRLTDEGPIIDAMNRLREFYPNVMQLERKAQLTVNTPGHQRLDHRKISEKDLFATFFEEMTQSQLTPAQEKAFVEVVERVRAEEERGVKP